MAPRERLFALEQFGIKLGLDNIRQLAAALGQPERACRTVHVAGTNGKGSVTAMVERGLRAAGYRTGRYTSPHLNDVEERIALDGQPVAAAAFDAAAAEILAIADRLQAAGALAAPPTFFEATTAMAFSLFRAARVDVAVIEVGLGGRFDATNIVTPLVSVITSIAFDHERHLGSTLAAIAFEKAGIIKPGVPVVVGDLPADAAAVVAEVAAAAPAPILAAREAAHYDDLPLALAGRHQRANARVAARTLDACRDAGLRVGAPEIAIALAQVEWPARLEWIALPGGQRVLLDAAHNPAGAQALAEYLRDSGAAPLPLVIAMMRDKDVTAMLAALLPVAARVVATETGSARALPAADLAAQVRAAAPSLPVAACADPVAALARALTAADRAAIAGSIFLVGPLRARLRGKLGG